MKKSTAKELRKLAEQLPPVYEWIPDVQVKTGAELNAVIIKQYEKEQAQLPWHKKLIIAIRHHLADIGFTSIAPKLPELKDAQAQYTLKKKTIRLVNHYRKLKEAWENGGQTGIAQYSQWAVQANKIQQTTKNQ